MRAWLRPPASGWTVCAIISATGGSRHTIGDNGRTGRRRRDWGRDRGSRCRAVGLDGAAAGRPPPAPLSLLGVTAGRAAVMLSPWTMLTSAPTDSAEAASLDHRAGDGRDMWESVVALMLRPLRCGVLPRAMFVVGSWRQSGRPHCWRPRGYNHRRSRRRRRRRSALLTGGDQYLIGSPDVGLGRGVQNPGVDRQRGPSDGKDEHQ